MVGPLLVVRAQLLQRAAQQRLLVVVRQVRSDRLEDEREPRRVALRSLERAQREADSGPSQLRPRQSRS